MVGVCLIFQETAELFFKMVVSFYIPSVSLQELFAPHPVNTWYVWSIPLILAVLIGV